MSGLMMIRAIAVNCVWIYRVSNTNLGPRPGMGGELGVSGGRSIKIIRVGGTGGMPHQATRSLAARNVVAGRTIRNSVVGSAISRASDTLICVCVL